MMSGRLNSALKSVPATKPSCTESVSQLAAPELRFHSFVRAGTTAEPLNQSDMPSSSAIANSASVRQRAGAAMSDEGYTEVCKPKDCSSGGSQPQSHDGSVTHVPRGCVRSPTVVEGHTPR